MFQRFQKLLSRNLLGTKASEMRCIDLAINKSETVPYQCFHQHDEPRLAGIAHMAEHALSAKHITHCHPVQSTYEVLPFPDLHGVCMPGPVQVGISRYDIRANPCTRSLAYFGTGDNYFRECFINREAEARAAKHLLHASADA